MFKNIRVAMVMSLGLSFLTQAGLANDVNTTDIEEKLAIARGSKWKTACYALKGIREQRGAEFSKENKLKETIWVFSSRDTKCLKPDYIIENIYQYSVGLPIKDEPEAYQIDVVMEEQTLTFLNKKMALLAALKRSSPDLVWNMEENSVDFSQVLQEKTLINPPLKLYNIAKVENNKITIGLAANSETNRPLNFKQLMFTFYPTVQQD